MSITTLIRCDATWGNEHTRCAHTFPRTGHTPQDLAAAARAVGWQVDVDGDLCPHHAHGGRMSA